MVQIWSIVVGLPLCAVGGVLYSWTSGKSVVDGIINAYGALYKIPGALCPCNMHGLCAAPGACPGITMREQVDFVFHTYGFHAWPTVMHAIVEEQLRRAGERSSRLVSNTTVATSAAPSTKVKCYLAVWCAAGVTVIGEVNAMTSHLMNVMWLVGTFTFATVIGIITEDVTSTIMVRCLASPHTSLSHPTLSHAAFISTLHKYHPPCKPMPERQHDHYCTSHVWLKT